MGICEFTGKRPQVKNLVSHSNIKTKKRANPNVQLKRFFSPTLNEMVRLYASTSAIRSMDHVGGFDRYVAALPAEKLSIRASRVQRKLLSKLRPATAQQAKGA